MEPKRIRICCRIQEIHRPELKVNYTRQLAVVNQDSASDYENHAKDNNDINN